ncbi:MAG: Eco57I restriction-modification methylase domain-containing protein [Promethearchaeota archaeon]
MSNIEVSKEIRIKIHQYLSKIESAEDVFKLFEALNYPEDVIFDITAKRKKDSFDFRYDDEKKINKIYSILSFENKNNIFLLETSTLAPSFIRSVSATFDRQYLNFILIFTINYSEIIFVFPNREKVNGEKHKLKLTKLIINKDEIYYTDVQTISSLYYQEGTNLRQVWRQWKSAFSVERVTKNFFENYKKIFFLLKKEFANQGIGKKESHEFTLQLLNRIMFIYFISKKEGWLNTKKFIKWFWNSYKKYQNYGKDEFYDVWLKQVFFKAFNNQANFITGLPNDIKKEISDFPYLNGGLFTPNDLDDLNVKISDRLFEEIFNFFEKYNFTIREDMPLEEEVAVDPQMIGYVYESLANVAEEIYDRHDLGIFYTPRIEVDFMAKRSLVEYLSNHLINIPKEDLYHLVFDTPEERREFIKKFDESFWYKLEEVLDNLSAVDPACGSGAFLVGLLNILTEMYRLINQNLNRKYTDFELKKRIIQYSLYGVDIMPWAIHAAELRLWLQLMVETKLKKEELRKYPLLPNLDLNLRIGDSLIQEIGGIFFNLRKNDLKPSIKKKLASLKEEKRNYFDNSPRARFKSPEEIKREELRIFEEIIDERLNFFDKEILKMNNILKQEKSKRNLLGKPAYNKQEIKKIEANITEYKNEIQKLKQIKKVLKNPEKKPFVWEIDFAEIFGDKDGFDIVIGNPPYVRQEDIAPFNKLKSEVSEKEKKEYKKKLVDSVKNQFPVIKNIDGKSDYYIYFYFHGLSLLNNKGVFCFITSNSWLDVGYGKDLQEFLLKYVPIIAIYDNPRRTFEHASINTIITLFGAPKFKQEQTIVGLKVQRNNQYTMLKHTMKFINFQKKFEEVINSKTMIELENIRAVISGKDILNLIKNLKKTEDFRVFPILQSDLLEDGWEYPDSYDKKNGRFKKGKYIGNKWGGKFLRAPDIFFKILEIGKSKLLRLGDIATVRFGIKTGANDFFYIDKKMQEKWKIEEKYLKPIFKSPKESKSIIINPDNLKFKVFMCNEPKSKLKGTNALKYIEWGENTKIKIKQGTLKGQTVIGFHNISSVKNRKQWYSLNPNFGANIFIQMSFDKIFAFYYSPTKLLADARLYEIVSDKYNSYELCLSLNSTLSILFMELFGRVNLGEGALDFKVYEAKNILFVPIKPESKNLLHYEPKSIFKEFNIDINKPIREQNPKPNNFRSEIDNLVFDKLGLNQEDRKEFYYAVLELVKKRLIKSISFQKNM